MNAYNVIWEGGTWKNGNWHGSDFEYNGGFIKNDGTTNNFMYNIVRRGFRNYGLNTIVYPSSTPTSPDINFNNSILLAGDNNLHIWNLFGYTNTTLTQISNNGSTNISFDISSEDLSVNAGIGNNWNIVGTSPDVVIVPTDEPAPNEPSQTNNNFTPTNFE